MKWPHLFFKRSWGLCFELNLTLAAAESWGWPGPHIAMGKARPSAWARPPPVELHLWTRKLARLFLFFFFTDFSLYPFSHPPCVIGLCFGFPNPHYNLEVGLPVWKARLGLENPDCKNSQEVEFSSEKMKLIVLIGAGVGRGEGSGK